MERLLPIMGYYARITFFGKSLAKNLTSRHLIINNEDAVSRMLAEWFFQVNQPPSLLE